MNTHLVYTILAILASTAVGLFSYHRHTKPHDKLSPRMVPWIIIAMGCLATGFMLIVHLVNILGLETGNR